MNFGLGELNLARIVTAVDVRNQASVRVLEKLGFRLAQLERGPRSFYHFELVRPDGRAGAA